LDTTAKLEAHADKEMKIYVALLEVLHYILSHASLRGLLEHMGSPPKEEIPPTTLI